MTDTETDLSAMSFEAALHELETLVARLESGELSLDESIRFYARGEALRAHCEARLKDAQMRIEKIVQPSGGTPVGTAAFSVD
jgi:exodeoxyribonuclease VII small subunit